MKVKFKVDKYTVNYGPVKKGDIVEVSTADGNAFIKSKIASKQKKES